MELEKVVETGKKVVKKTGKFLYETGKGIVKGVGKAGYETGKGIYKGIYGSSDTLSEDNLVKEGTPLDKNSLKHFPYFFKYLREANLPQKNYDGLSSLVSGNSYSSLSDADRIDKSLSLLDRMYVDNYINKRTHKKLKKILYYEFKKGIKNKGNSKLNPLFGLSFNDYIPLVTSFLFFFFGILLLTPVLTGFSIVEDIAKFKLNLLGLVFFLLSISFFGMFIRRMKMKKVIGVKK